MVRMVPDVMVHKYDTLVNEGGGGKDKKVSVIGVLENKPKPTTDKDGMDMVLIDMEVVNSQLDYNLLLGCSYMYAMRVVASTIFQLLMFPHDGNIMTIDQLTYYDSKGSNT